MISDVVYGNSAHEWRVTYFVLHLCASSALQKTPAKHNIRVLLLAFKTRLDAHFAHFHCVLQERSDNGKASLRARGSVCSQSEARAGGASTTLRTCASSFAYHTLIGRGTLHSWIVMSNRRSAD